MGSDPKVHTFEEVSKHNQYKDCWLILNGKVYDVSSFIDEHPGGDEVLISSTGKDATKDFEDIGHSEAATEMLHEYYIGDIDPSTFSQEHAYVPPLQPPYNHDKTSDFLIKILQLLLPLLILGLAFVVRHYTKKE